MDDLGSVDQRMILLHGSSPQRPAEARHRQRNCLTVLNDKDDYSSRVSTFFSSAHAGCSIRRRWYSAELPSRSNWRSRSTASFRVPRRLPSAIDSPDENYRMRRCATDLPPQSSPDSERARRSAILPFLRPAALKFTRTDRRHSFGRKRHRIRQSRPQASYSWEIRNRYVQQFGT